MPGDDLGSDWLDAAANQETLKIDSKIPEAR